MSEFIMIESTKICQIPTKHYLGGYYTLKTTPYLGGY